MTYAFLCVLTRKRHVLLCRIHNCERCFCAPFASVCICGCVCVPLDHPLCLQTGGLGGGLLANQHSSSTVISNFWCHDGVMMMIPWSQNLKCPKSDHVKFWESRNLDHVKFWEHQKSDHVKNWDVPKIWWCQNLRIPKIWSCQKCESKILKSFDADVIMISW